MACNMSDLLGPDSCSLSYKQVPGANCYHGDQINSRNKVLHC